MFVIITKAYDCLAVCYLCVNHVFGLEPLDCRSDDLMAHPGLVRDLPQARANRPPWDKNSLAF